MTTFCSTKQDTETIDKKEIRGIVKRLRELYTTNRINSDVFDLMIRMALETEMIEGLEKKMSSKEKDLFWSK